MSKIWFAVVTTVLLACCRPETARSEQQQWLAAWACAPQLTEQRNLPPQPGLSSNTLRQIVRTTVAGKSLRARFSNAFGDAPLTIASAHAAMSVGHGDIDVSTDKPIEFGHSPSITIAPGTDVVSDPFDFDLPQRTLVAVTIHFGAVGAAVTGHPGSRMTSYLTAGDAVIAPNAQGAATTQHWYILTGLDAMAPEPAGAIVAFGDSITDGRGSTTDGNDRWPDELANRLTNGAAARISVINAGIGGNAVVTGGLGPTALSRFDRDVLAPPGVRWLILFEGVNDIGSSASTNVSAKLISAYQTMLAKARSHKIRVYGATITPFGASFYDSPRHEQARQSVNYWIRNSGAFDAVIDFDSVARDPNSPSKLEPAYDTGDHLHMNPAGYRALADSIDLHLFAP